MLVLPLNFVSGITFLLPLYAQADVQFSSNPGTLSTDENNLADLNACSNFSAANPQVEKYDYVLNGNKYQLSTTIYPGLAQCLLKLKQKTSCPNCQKAIAEDQDDKDVINNSAQDNKIQELADNIKKTTPDKNDQARIAINIVQGFRYDDSEHDGNDYNYPYVVAMRKSGICNETSKLTLLLLRDLGFGGAMFTFEKENHQAIGIKCDQKYSYMNTGYCFVETTSRAIITDTVGEKMMPRISVISDGLTFDASKDFEDAHKFVGLYYKKGLSSQEQLTFSGIRNRYGLDKTE